MLFRLDDRLPWLLPSLLLLSALGILGTAILSELYGVHFRLFDNRNLAPCPLCTVQRLPYALVIVLCGAAALLSAYAMERALLLSLTTLLLTFGALVSGFHAGGEYGWWLLGQSCGGTLNPDAFSDVMIISEGLTPAPSCSDAAWRFPREAGLSMAGFNFVFSVLMGGVTLVFTLAAIARLPKP